MRRFRQWLGERLRDHADRLEARAEAWRDWARSIEPHSPVLDPSTPLGRLMKASLERHAAIMADALLGQRFYDEKGNSWGKSSGETLRIRLPNDYQGMSQ